MNVLLCLTATLVIICLIMTCLIIGLPFWVMTNSQTFYGLWDLCIGLTDHEAVCRWFSTVGLSFDPYFDATRAMVCIALILVTIATVLTCVVCCCKQKSTICRLVAAVLCLLAAICLVVAMIVFGVMFDDNGGLFLTDLSGAYWLMLFTILFLLASVVLLFFSRAEPKDVDDW